MEVEVWSQEVLGWESGVAHMHGKGEFALEVEGGPSASMLWKSFATRGPKEGGTHSQGIGESLAATTLFGRG